MIDRALIIVVLFAQVNLLGCENKCGSTERVIEMIDSAQHEILKNRMEKEGIPFHTGEDGRIWYPCQNFDRVTNLVKVIAAEDMPAGRSVHYAQPDDRNMFIKELERNGIPYETKIRFGDEVIVWPEEHSPQVAKIQRLIDVTSTPVNE